MSIVGIVNLGIGNLGSIQNMIKRCRGKSILLNEPADLDKVEKIVLAGVGAFDNAMIKVEEFGWREALDKAVLTEKKPILGICLGMQMMCKSSEEGTLPGFSWIDAHVKKFTFTGKEDLKIPHMGWNSTIIKNQSTCPIKTEELNPRFYFVHSYFVECEDVKDQWLFTTYGKSFVAGFNKENIFGVQFHPEKSHRFGMNILDQFIRL